MIRKRGAPPQSRADIVRARGLAFKRGHHLGANALDRLLVETRLRQRQPQQVETLVLAVGQNLERAANLVTAGPEGQLDRVAVALRLERLGVEIAGAFVQQCRHHVGDAGLADRILVGPALEREFHRDQRHGRLAHQPGFDPARADHPLDLGHRLRLRRAQKQGADDNGGERRRYAACEKTIGDHERRSCGLACSLTRYPVTERRLSSQVFAASRTCSGVTF